MASAASPRHAQQRTRRYRSPKRQDQARRTQRRILAAATERFRSLGYASTTIGAVATAAAVSVPTVALAFGTKAALLTAAIDVAIAGDDEPVPVLERPWAARARATTTPEAFLAVVAQVLARAAQRADALVLVALEAARGDRRLAPLATQLKTQRAVTAGWIVDVLDREACIGQDSNHGSNERTTGSVEKRISDRVGRSRSPGHRRLEVLSTAHVVGL